MHTSLTLQPLTPYFLNPLFMFSLVMSHDTELIHERSLNEKLWRKSGSASAYLMLLFLYLPLLN